MQPKRAVALYDGALTLGFAPNMQIVTTLLRALTPSSDAPASGGAARSGWPTERPSREASSGSDSLGRVMGAMKMLERRQVLPDTFLLNQLMRAYTLLEQYDKAEDVFYRVMKAGGASQAEAKARPCAPDVVSWNIMIDGYARQGKPALARRCFREMLEQPHESIQPDKFTYTALLKSYVMVDDFAAAEQILEEMEQRAAAYTRSLRNANVDDVLEGSDGAVALPPPTPDVFLYNTLIEGYSRCLRWREAEATLQQMRSRGLQPNADTYSVLVPCLTRAKQSTIAVDKLEEVRELGIPLNTAM